MDLGELFPEPQRLVAQIPMLSWPLVPRRPIVTSRCLHQHIPGLALLQQGNMPETSVPGFIGPAKVSDIWFSQMPSKISSLNPRDNAKK